MSYRNSLADKHALEKEKAERAKEEQVHIKKLFRHFDTDGRYTPFVVVDVRSSSLSACRVMLVQAQGICLVARLACLLTRVCCWPSGVINREEAHQILVLLGINPNDEAK